MEEENYHIEIDCSNEANAIVCKAIKSKNPKTPATIGVKGE